MRPTTRPGSLAFPSMRPTPKTRSAIRRTIDALDFVALGQVYCDHGGDAFWADRRAPLLELGIAWAEETARRVRRQGSSLYVGAGVAEIPAMLVEVLDLDRTVVACNLRAQECAVVNRAFTGLGIPLQLVGEDARNVTGSFDHVSLVSVLCDPETFPYVSDVTYGRLHPVHLDAAAFAAEQGQATALVDAVLARLQLPGLVTTTVEEVPWVMAWAERAAIKVTADDTMLETAVVGDPIGFLQLARAVES